MTLVAWWPGASPDLEAPLRQLLSPKVELVCAPLAEGLPETIRSRVQALVLGTPDAELLDALPALQAVLIPYAGVPPRTAEALVARPEVGLYNLHHNAAPTAEMALTLLLSVWKDIDGMGAPLRQGDWRPRYEVPHARTVEGRRVMILGYGAIGRRLGRALHAMGCQVLGVRRDVASEPAMGEVEVMGAADWRTRLPECDALVIALPATAETDGLVDAEALQALPRGAVLVNVGRGRIVEEGALDEALRSGHLAGAGLDVWWHYPRSEEERADCPPGTTGLHALPQVVVSPHRAGLTVENEAQRAAGTAAFLDALVAGREPPGRVDPGRGY